MLSLAISFNIYLNSYCLLGERLKWCVLDLSPIWLEKIEIIIYEWDLVYFAIGMPEIELAISDARTLSFYVGYEPIGIATYASLSQGFHYYSIDEKKFISGDSVTSESINSPQWVCLPTMSRSTYFTEEQEIYIELLKI